MADDFLSLNLHIGVISLVSLGVNKLWGIDILNFNLFHLLRYDLAVLIMFFRCTFINSGQLCLFLRGDGESVAFELSWLDLDFFLLVLFHALSLWLFFLVILLLNILMAEIYFDRCLFWRDNVRKLLEIIWRILFVKLSLLKKGVWLETNDGHLSLPLSITAIFLCHIMHLIVRHHFIFCLLLVHLDYSVWLEDFCFSTLS